MGGRADGHLTVSQALADWLKREYGVSAVVAYDRPSDAFAPPSPAAAAALWERLAKDTHSDRPRPPIVLCPTSWTPDEDFDLAARSARTCGTDA